LQVGDITLVFQSYSKYYDIIYADKDYEKECNFLEEIFRKYLAWIPKTVLDAGCGTGGHALLLAKRGYEVTGVDASNDMIEIARKKAKESGVDVDFFTADLRELRLNRKFDACICMFAVMNYITENEDIKEVLSNVRVHLKRGGLFVFDFWYGPAVLSILPSARMKTVERGGMRTIRIAEPSLDIARHLCEVKYHLLIIKRNRIVDEVKEKHKVRFLFPQEIAHYLTETGLKLLRLCAFLDLESDPSEKIWNAVAISKAA